MSTELKVMVWNEGRHEKEHPAVAKVYPNGLHSAIAEGLKAHGFSHVRTAVLDEPEHGLTVDVLNNTDVLLWWGHMAHGDVNDEIVERVQQRVLAGMGLLVLHSGHFSKIFKRLMGTSCDLKWREHDHENERLWVVAPAHPIAAGLPQWIDLDHEEMYGEHFDIPQPDDTRASSVGSRAARSSAAAAATPRPRAHLLLPPRPRDLPHLSPAGSAARHQQCRALGAAGGASLLYLWPAPAAAGEIAQAEVAFMGV